MNNVLCFTPRINFSGLNIFIDFWVKLLPKLIQSWKNVVQDSMVMAQGSRFLNLGTKILKIEVQDFFSWILDTTQKWGSTGAGKC